MSSEVTDWIPIGLAEHESVQSVLREAIAAWSDAWFPGRSLRVCATLPTLDEAAPWEGAPWRTWGEAVAISCPRKALSRLAERALDAKLDQLTIGDVDRQIIQAFEGRIIGDLAQRLDAALDVTTAPDARPRTLDAPFGGLGGLVLGVGEGQGAQLLSVAIPMKTLAPLCRALFPPASPALARLDKLTEALKPTAVPLEASLGRIGLSLADLRDLCVGDVLVTDVAIDDGAILRLADGEPLARADMIEQAGHRALALQG